MKEIWKRIQNTEYRISSTGNVFSEKSNRFLSQSLDGRGYFRVTLWIDGEQTTEKVHRLVATTFIPSQESGLEVNHINGIKTDNSVSNLEWITHIDNMKHAHATGLMQIGSESYIAKLDESSVEEIKLLFIKGLSNQEISNKYGVARGTISKIRQLKTWKAVRPDLVFESNCTSKYNKKALKGEDIPEIRALQKSGVSLAEIGKLFGVHSGTISGIILGKTWTNY